MQIARQVTCSVCKGTGADTGGLEECDQCHGSGQIVKERQSGASVFREISTCRKCGGKGSIVKKPCGECRGRGYVEKTKELSVKIPHGAYSGYAIKKEGEGAPGKDLPGDLYVVIDVEKHAVFERHEDDLYRREEIPFTLAALGGRMETFDLEGNPYELEIPEGTQTGMISKIEGKGIPHLEREGRGDEYVVLKVVTPTDLSETQKELLKKFQKLESDRLREVGGR